MTLQEQFELETGIKAINSQGEPDIDYMAWLEEKAEPKEKRYVVALYWTKLFGLPKITQHFVTALSRDEAFEKSKESINIEDGLFSYSVETYAVIENKTES